MADQFNIYLKPTAAESPRSNGVVGRHNVILIKAIEKLILDHKNKQPIDNIIAWVANIKKPYIIVMVPVKISFWT